MNSIQCRILVFLVLLTSCFSPVCGKDKKPRQAIEKLSIDGPYLLKADDGSMRAISVDGKGRLLDKHYKSIPTSFSFEVFSDNGERLFPVTIHSVSRPKWKDVQPEKTFVLSDPHANWSCFASLLKAGKVIDADYNWIFGTNQLVIIGDVFDRGVDVLPIYWLIYKLEKEAEDAGGKVTGAYKRKSQKRCGQEKGTEPVFGASGREKYHDPGFRQDGQRSDHPYQGKCQTNRAGTGIQTATKSKVSRQAVGEESTPDHKASDRAGKYHAKDIICTEKGTGGQGCKADCHP